MARVRNLVILFVTLCCHASVSHAEDIEFEGTQDFSHEQLVEFARRIAGEMELLELELGIQDKNEDQMDIVKSLSKRQAVDRHGVPMNVPVKMSGFAFGKRDAPLVRRSAGAGSKPVKLAGFAFGKRNPVKRSSDNEANDKEEKRVPMDAFAFGKRPSGDPTGLSAFSFGKRRDPLSSLSALAFGKRGMDPSGFNAFSFGKRRDPLSAFSFGKRGMDGLNAFNFGKRGRDSASLSAFNFGKRGRMPMGSLSAFDFGKRGMDAFAFGKREDLDEEGAFQDENDDKKRAFNGLSGYAFGKRDTDAAAEDTLNHNDETLRTDN